MASEGHYDTENDEQPITAEPQKTVRLQSEPLAYRDGCWGIASRVKGMSPSE
jgi:hypothetical protein